MSLADELLADLDDNEVSQEQEDDPFTAAKAKLQEASHGSEDVPMETDEDSKVQVPTDLVGPLKPTKALSSAMVDNPITEFAKLRNSDKLTNVMSQIDHFSKQTKREKVEGPVEADPEYHCIVESNNLIVEIDNEIGMSFLSKRFHVHRHHP